MPMFVKDALGDRAEAGGSWAEAGLGCGPFLWGGWLLCIPGSSCDVCVGEEELGDRPAMMAMMSSGKDQSHASFEEGGWSSVS